VLEATRAELAAGGLRIEHVAAEAGVNKTTIYRRWGSRAGLVAEALLEVSEAEVPIPDHGSLRDDLLAVADNVHRAITSSSGRMLAAAVSACGLDDAEIKVVTERFWQRRYAANRVVVDRAVARGELPSGVDLRQLVASLVGPLYFRAYVTHEPIDGGFLRRTVDTVVAGIATTVPGVDR
jgi:AcrR family transcriptional regulator